MTLGAYLRFVRREARGSRGRLVFFVACLSVGVAAVVAVAGLASGLDRAIRSEARQLLAADLAVEGTRPIPSALDAVLGGVPGLRRATTREMATVVAVPPSHGAPGTSQLVELKAVDGPYPFYGAVKLDPPEPLGVLLDPESTVIAPEVAARLGVRRGDLLRIGGVDFRVAGTVAAEPDRIALSFTLAPRVFVSGAGLDRAGLERFGSRIEYRLLVKLADGTSTPEIEAFAARLKAVLPPGGWHHVETFSDAQPALRRGLNRAERFLGLVALLSLLVGGIGIAQTVRAWIAGRLDAIATLRCLGLRPREVIALYLGQTAFLSVLGSAAGVLAGTIVLGVVPRVLGGLVPPGVVEPWQPWAAGRGLGLGIAIAMLFSVPPLADLRRVPPLRVFRRDAEPLPGSRWARGGAAVVVLAGVLATAWAQSHSAKLGVEFTAGILAATAALAFAAWSLTRTVSSLPRRFARVWLRHGLAGVARPGAGTLGAIVALGLGVLVVLGMYLVQSGLAEQLQADLPTQAPTAFLLDVQPGQMEGVAKALESEGATGVRSVPMVTARLRAIDGRSTETLAKDAPDEGRAKWVLTREQRLTYLDELSPDNTIVEGALWSDPARAEVSVEKDFARDLGVRLGSVLTFDVQGVPLDLEVTSLRKVDWRTFGINFFLVVEPGVLEKAPQVRVAVARIPAGREQAVQDALAVRFPNVTLLRIRDVLEKVVAVLDRIGWAVRVLGGFTVVAGIAILAGAIGAASVRRGREVALLKTLGMTRAGVVAVFSVEYALIGAVSGVIGALGAAVLAWFVLVRGMEIPFEVRGLPYLAAIAGTMLLSVAAGVAASAGALARRPVESLR